MMYVDHIHPCQVLPLLPFHPTSLPTQFWDFIFFFFTHQVQYVLSRWSWECGLPWGVVNLPGATSLKRTASSSASNYQMPAAPQLVVEFHVYLSLSELEFCLVGACTGLLHAIAIAVNSYVYLPFYVWKAGSLVLSSSSHSLSFPHRSLSIVGRGVIWMSPLGLRTPVSYSLHDDQLSISVLSAIYCNKLLWWEVRDALIYGYSIALGVIFILCPFKRIIALGSFL